MQVDPFLHLVQDGKLQAVNPGSVGASKAYGSKEDDEYALKALSQIKIAEEHARESFATIIVKSLENLSEVKKKVKIIYLLNKARDINCFMPNHLNDVLGCCLCSLKHLYYGSN